MFNKRYSKMTQNRYITNLIGLQLLLKTNLQTLLNNRYSKVIHKRYWKNYLNCFVWSTNVTHIYVCIHACMYIFVLVCLLLKIDPQTLLNSKLIHKRHSKRIHNCYRKVILKPYSKFIHKCYSTLIHNFYSKLIHKR